MSNASEEECSPVMEHKGEGRDLELDFNVQSSQIHSVPAVITRFWRIGLIATLTFVALLLCVASSTVEQTAEDTNMHAKIEHVVSLAGSNAAACCSKWTPNCYSTPGPNNKHRAFKQCSKSSGGKYPRCDDDGHVPDDAPCHRICEWGAYVSSSPLLAGSRACQLCCTNFPDDYVDWECDASFSAGNSTGGFVNSKVCAGSDLSCVQRSSKELNEADCQAWCESWGLPGCCSSNSWCSFSWSESNISHLRELENPKCHVKYGCYGHGQGYCKGNTTDQASRSAAGCNAMIISAGSQSEKLFCIASQGLPSQDAPTTTMTTTKAPGLTDLQQAGIAIGAVAGAGIIAGGIAASQVAHGPASAASPAGASTVPVLTPVLQGSRLNQVDDKTASAAKVGDSASRGMFMGAAPFVLFVCFFLGVSGLIYIKTRVKRSTRVVTHTEVDQEDSENAESLLES